VPDIVTSGGLLRPIARDPSFKLIRVCKEDECIGIASGLSYCDIRALTLIQHTGFLDSINAIRGVGIEFRQPICMMIGLLQHDPATTPRIAALRRAHHRADPRGHGHPAPPDQR
jgi:sulfopyruvate decarboxylase TPP-binding subunit